MVTTNNKSAASGQETKRLLAANQQAIVKTMRSELQHTQQDLYHMMDHVIDTTLDEKMQQLQLQLAQTQQEMMRLLEQSVETSLYTELNGVKKDLVAHLYLTEKSLAENVEATLLQNQPDLEANAQVTDEVVRKALAEMLPEMLPGLLEASMPPPPQQQPNTNNGEINKKEFQALRDDVWKRMETLESSVQNTNRELRRQVESWQMETTTRMQSLENSLGYKLDALLSQGAYPTPQQQQERQVSSPPQQQQQQASQQQQQASSSPPPVVPPPVQPPSSVDPRFKKLGGGTSYLGGL